MSPIRHLSIIYDVLGLLTLSIFMAVDSKEIIFIQIAVSEQFRISKLAGGNLSNLIGIYSSHSLNTDQSLALVSKGTEKCHFFPPKLLEPPSRDSRFLLVSAFRE